MKKSLALALAAAVLAPASYAQSFTDQANVIDARPIRERIPIKREECWNERVKTYENRTVTRTDTNTPLGAGAVLGAVIGGVVGHQFGNSSGGRDRATAAGAVLGGVVGHSVERENNRGERVVETERVPTGTRDVERCRMVEEMREVTAFWDVRYSYNGREFSTRMPFDPGRRLDIAVNVTPIEERGPRGDRGPGPSPRPSQPRY